MFFKASIDDVARFSLPASNASTPRCPKKIGTLLSNFCSLAISPIIFNRNIAFEETPFRFSFIELLPIKYEANIVYSNKNFSCSMPSSTYVSSKISPSCSNS